MIHNHRNRPPTDRPASRAQAPLRAERLCVGYGGLPVVEGINFDVSAGRALALVGTNGSGKSTLLKTVVGLLPALHGSISVFNADPGAIPRRVGYLSQFHSSGFVLPLRAIDIVLMGRFPARGLLGRMKAEDHKLVRESMRRMGVDKIADVPIRSLSGGQQQRVYLAQVLAREAGLLVLDEPTASLDAAGKAVFACVLEEELARGASVLVATHDIREAARCDLVMLLARRVVAYGTPSQVLTHEALLETFGVVLAAEGQQGSIVLESDRKNCG